MNAWKSLLRFFFIFLRCLFSFIVTVFYLVLKDLSLLSFLNVTISFIYKNLWHMSPSCKDSRLSLTRWIFFTPNPQSYINVSPCSISICRDNEWEYKINLLRAERCVCVMNYCVLPRRTCPMTHCYSFTVLIYSTLTF